MLTLPPVKGEISLAGAFPFAGVGGSARTRVIVVVVVVVVVVAFCLVVLVSCVWFGLFSSVVNKNETRP